jgi:hypothetical protein
MGEEDTGEMSDASPPAPWEHGVDERFADESLGSFDDEAYTVEEEEVSDTEMSAGSPAAPPRRCGGAWHR